jgi:hypothetical protein
LKFLAPRPLLHAEGLAVLVGACLLYRRLDASWLMFAVLFFAPDISMIGYAAGLRAGATCYNFLHTYVLPVAIGAAAYLEGSHIAVCVCVIWAAHIGFDRMLGYGLKYETAFKDTHIARS